MKSSLILTLGAVSLLTACGDGNGISEDKSGNNNGNGNGGAGGDTSITVANAMTVTNLTYQVALSTGAAAEFSGGTGLLSSSSSPISKIDGSFATANAANATTASIPIPPTVENCPVSGTSTLSGDIADPITPTFTQNDYFEILYAACDDGFSVIDGQLLYTVDAFSGDLLSGVYDLTMTATFTDFQIATSEDTLVSNGDVTVRLDSQVVPTITTTVSGTSLTIDGGTDAQTLSNFASMHSQNIELVPSPYDQTSSGTLDSTRLPGVVTYSTPVPFSGFDSDYPSEGEFLISAPNSSAKLIAVDNINILIEVDADGDGVVDDTIESTWAALNAS